MSTWDLQFLRSLPLLVSLMFSSACALDVVSSTSTVAVNSATSTPEPSIAATQPATQTATGTPAPTSSPSPTPYPTVDSLGATVAADLLSCRYGPGPNYLFLYGLRKDANIVLIGRTDADNWHWVYVEGKNKCWVNTSFIDMAGNWMNLPVVYPGMAKLPISPYYPPTTVLSAVRKNDEVTVEWADVPLRAGDEEDENMQHYIIELWHCKNGSLLFEPVATNELSTTFIDQPSCSLPSHGRIFVQEKHGFAGPSEIPWPPFR